MYTVTVFSRGLVIGKGGGGNEAVVARFGGRGDRKQIVADTRTLRATAMRGN
jgi:hypothetical protein